MQHLLLLVIALLVGGLAFLVTKWPSGLHMTFSLSAATNRWSKLYYCLLFLLTMPLLMWFFAAWFAPHKAMPEVFLWCAAVAISFQVLCTFVPETGGIKTTIHAALTGVSVVAMLPLVGIVATTASLSVVTRVVAWLGLAAMLAIICTALKLGSGYKRVLLLQASYYVVFLIVMVTATYT